MIDRVETEPDFRAMLDKYREAMVVVGPDQVIRWANKAAGEFLKVPGPDLAGRSLTEFIRIDQTVSYLAEPDQMLIYQQPCAVEGDNQGVALIERMDMDDHLALLCLRSLDEDGHQKPPPLFPSVVANLEDYAIFTLFQDGRIASWNTGAQRITGYRAEEVLGEPFDLIFTDLDREHHVPEIELQRARRQGRAEDLRWHRRKDGSRFWANGILLTLTCAGVGSHLLLKIIRDDTDTQQRLIDLEENAENIERFSASLVHDLRRPLSTAGMTIDMILDYWGEGLDPKARDLLRNSANGLADLNTMFTSVLSYARAQNADWEGQDIHLNSQLPIIERQFEGDLHHLSASLEYTDLPSVHCDRGILTLIFHNLIDNALKYGGKEPKIMISGEPGEPGQQIITVADNGDGIPPDERERVFEPYHQIRQGHGLGLGLANCKRFVESWGGRIWIEDAEGGGAAFRFTIPAAKGEAEQQKQEPSGSV
jgi:PAS domain S-box-containing protein